MSRNLSVIGKLITEALFGKYLGAQVFIAPITLFYLIKSDSLLAAGTSLISLNIHLFPLLVFLIMAWYVIFMIIKLKLLIKGSGSDYLDSIIQLNVSLLALVLIALIIYALATFMAYFYGIRETMKHAMYFLFKFYTALMIIYQYLYNDFLKPLSKPHYSRIRTERIFLAWARNRKMLLLRYTLLMFLVILAATRLYQLIIQYALIPFLEGVKTYAGMDIRITLSSFIGIGDVLYNVLLCILAFLISNLLFYPLVLVIEYLIHKYLPFEMLLRNYRAEAKN